jgi:hypothetical protein
MVKRDWRPWRNPLLWIVPFILVIAVATWVLKGAQFWPALLGGVGAMVWCFGSPIREFVTLRGAEKRRRAAANGTQWFPLASPQPYPDPEALPLPFVISIRPGWLTFLLTPIITWIVVVCGIYFRFWAYVWPNEGPVIHTLALTLALMLASSAVILFSMYRWIEADENGLTVRNLFWSKRILWHEARLFAVDAALKAGDDLKRYELSSSTAILRWPWKRKPSPWTRLSCSFAEYEWQMKALHCVIAARTGLPLYDLREGIAANVPQAVPSPLPPPSIPAQP